jgi:hypothetical protein
VLVVLVQPEVDGELVHLAVHPDTGKALLGVLVELLAVLALAPPHHRGEHEKARLLRKRQNLLDHLLRRGGRHGEAANVAVRPSGAGVQQAQVVVDFRHRRDGGARVVRRGFLVDGDGGREAVDVVHVRLVHLAEELPRVGRKALHVAALALGVDGVESQG